MVLETPMPVSSCYAYLYHGACTRRAHTAIGHFEWLITSATVCEKLIRIIIRSRLSISTITARRGQRWQAEAANLARLMYSNHRIDNILIPIPYPWNSPFVNMQIKLMLEPRFKVADNRDHGISKARKYFRNILRAIFVASASLFCETSPQVKG